MANGVARRCRCHSTLILTAKSSPLQLRSTHNNTISTYHTHLFTRLHSSPSHTQRCKRLARLKTGFLFCQPTPTGPQSIPRAQRNRAVKAANQTQAVLGRPAAVHHSTVTRFCCTNTHFNSVNNLQTTKHNQPVSVDDKTHR